MPVGRGRLAVSLATASLLLAEGPGLRADPASRTRLVEAMLAEDLEQKEALLRQVTDATDPVVTQALTAWRGGSAYVQEEGTHRIPFLLDSQTDADGNAHGLRIVDGEPLKDAAGTVLSFAAFELTPLDANPRLRRLIKTTLDVFALSHPEPRMRRDAVIKLGQEQNPEYLPRFEQRLQRERAPEVRRALSEAIAMTRLADADAATRVEAIRRLSELRSINALSFLKDLAAGKPRAGLPRDAETVRAAARATKVINDYIWWGNLFGTAFRGLSLAAVLLVAALGLAITFGLMGVINMAHGEIMMVGAYTTYLTQNLFQSLFGSSGAGFDCYFVAALGFSFIAAGAVGLALERGIIRFLYSRPLESLLATWGVSLVLQQVFRHVFGAANVQVGSPSWLSGSFEINDVLLAYNRLFVIAFAVLIVLGTVALLTRTSLGLQIRAVMQNRSMASAMGVRTERVNMLTFALGSGLAGMAGACLSQIGNVGPSLGQAYIVDCFMVVVLGGIGSLLGTVYAALGIGVADQILQPWLGAVMGKITVLVAIILFLQWRPSGLFAMRSRSLEGG